MGLLARLTRDRWMPGASGPRCAPRSSHLSCRRPASKIGNKISNGLTKSITSRNDKRALRPDFGCRVTTIRSRYNQALAVDCGAAGWHASSARGAGTYPSGDQVRGVRLHRGKKPVTSVGV
ncbi:Uncharacterised protein [Mycobacteroides abscessus subsp. abscessus]|nr:Uncharacterised protein [Mycobacteroides abscessus subsp. abscessus]